MITYQFDECFDDPDVIDACNKQGKAVARRIDDDLKEKKDPEVLAVLMLRTTPMLTTDGKLPWKHSARIPEINPGIVTVGYSRYGDRKGPFKTLTTTAAGKILEALKERCPNWDQLVLKNSIVEVTNKEIVISHIEHGQLKYDNHIEYGDDLKLQTELVAILKKNAARRPMTKKAIGRQKKS
jgi:hypothetical protein